MSATKQNQGRRTLKQLERENDVALRDYWNAVLTVEECRSALAHTKEALILRVAENDRDAARERMGKARHAYLVAKIEREAQ